MATRQQQDSIVEVYALDAGHGACTLIFVKTGNKIFTAMVDCGTMLASRDYIARLARITSRAVGLLRDNADGRLDALVVSHSDLDHICGINGFIKELVEQGGQVGTVYYNRDRVTKAKGPQDIFNAMSLLKAQGLVDTDFATKRPLFANRDCAIDILGPEPDEVNRLGGGQDANVLSAVVQVVHGDTSLLICGDAYAERLSRLGGLRAATQIVFAPHHGGDIGSKQQAQDAYRRLRPSLVVLSAGVDTVFCSTHLGAVHAMSAGLMCTGANGPCKLTKQFCAGEVRARLGKKQFWMKPTAASHRQDVRAFPSRACRQIPP